MKVTFRDTIRYCPNFFTVSGKVIYYARQQDECAVCLSRQLKPLPEGDDDVPGIEQVLRDPAASLWIKEALRSALSRDPVDAADDADVLARVLDARLRTFLN